jgi:hypothetical protein
MKSLKLALFCLSLLFLNNLIAQSVVKVKFIDKYGNIIYYQGVEGTDDVEYCVLYYIPKKTNATLNVKTLKKHLENTLAGDICYPDLIMINQKVFQIKIKNYGESILLTSRDGEAISFKPI